MTSPLKATDPAVRKPSSFRIQLMLVVVLAVVFFLLGQSMVRHRYFGGQRVHRNGSIGQ